MTQFAKLAFDGVSYTESDFIEWARYRMPDGVFDGVLNELEPFGDSTGLNVKVKSGHASVKGVHYINDAQVTLSVTSNSSGSTRVDRVVVHFDFGANTFDVRVVAGTPGAGAPALVQSSTIWEISLATVSIPSGDAIVDPGQVTDTRTFVSAAGLIVATATLTLPSVKVTKSADQGPFTAGVDTVITWNQEEWDYSTPMHDNATNNTRLVAPVTGKYWAGATLVFINGTTTRQTAVFKNGVEVPGGRAAAVQGGGGVTDITINVPVALTAGQYVEIFAHVLDTSAIVAATSGTAKSSAWLVKYSD